jgi:hypothetical protein
MVVATVDDARRNGQNPSLPTSLQKEYDAAWRQLVEIGLRELSTSEDPVLTSSILAVVAIGKGQPILGRFAVMFTEDERKEILTRAGWP